MIILDYLQILLAFGGLGLNGTLLLLLRRSFKVCDEISRKLDEHIHSERICREEMLSRTTEAQTTLREHVAYHQGSDAQLDFLSSRK